MSTQLFLEGGASTESDLSRGTNDAALNGTTTRGWIAFRLSTSRSAATQNIAVSTVAGATNGIEIGNNNTTSPRYEWITLPLDADVTISGSITWNIWASETNMSANVAINGIIYVMDGATGALTLIDKTARTVEVAVTTRAVNNFAETPAAGIACKRGDRLVVRLFGDDAGTMASTFLFDASWGSPTGGVDGDTFVTLTENLTFVSEPAGTTIYPTDTASAVATASVDREAWTSPGAGVQTDVTNTTTGFTAPLQVTDTAGGTVVDWFTPTLTAFTLGGAVRVNAHGQQSGGGGIDEVCMAVQIAVVDGDGTNAVVWAFGSHGGPEVGAGSEETHSWLVAGDDLAVTSGKRLRIRFSWDDYDIAMLTGRTPTFYYAGTTGGASGDTFLTFTQTLTELVAADRVPYVNPMPQFLAQ